MGYTAIREPPPYMVEIHRRSEQAPQLDEVPRHYEGMSPRGALIAAGWAVGLLGAGGGVALMVLGADTALELPGALLAALGAVLLTAVVRCRRAEVLVSTRWLEVRVGPFRHRVPVDWVGGAETRAARSWRRLYAERELVVALTAGERELVAPTREPEDLVTAIAQHRDR